MPMPSGPRSSRALFLYSISFITMAVAASGCAMHVVVDPQIPRDVVTQPALRTFMQSVPNPTVVLRVPSPQRQVTAAQGPQGDAAMNQAYNLIERELVKAGFTVRDRGLLEEVVRSNQNLDYRIIQQKTNAQLILEIVSISPRAYNTDQYSRVKDEVSGRLQYGTFPLNGWQFECKVIIVDSGEIGGIYTIHVGPRQNHFVVQGKQIRNASGQGRPDQLHTGYTVQLQDAIQPFVQGLIAELRQR